MKAVVWIIARFGFNIPILCDHQYRIQAGHTRLEAARRLGMESMPVVQLRLSVTEENAFAIAENKTRELLKRNASALKVIPAELHEDSIDIKDLGFTTREMQRLIQALRESEEKQPMRVGLSRCGKDVIYRLGQLAAERNNRNAYVIEMRPEYCDRIIQRWETPTGNKARRESG